MAVLHARGEMSADDQLTAVSLIARPSPAVLGITMVSDTAAVRPEIAGRGWITGIYQHMLDPSDPGPGGYRLTEAWGAK